MGSLFPIWFFAPAGCWVYNPSFCEPPLSMRLRHWLPPGTFPDFLTPKSSRPSLSSNSTSSALLGRIPPITVCGLSIQGAPWGQAAFFNLVSPSSTPILTPSIKICELMTKVTFLPFQRRKGLVPEDRKDASSLLLFLFLMKNSREGQAGCLPNSPACGISNGQWVAFMWICYKQEVYSGESWGPGN